ncbi:hypothetical protein PPACK8108_LOCUS6940 [Phakopsora pachyrhizi]|uniref:Uncharacterized protein n=1 Tax=Phakopsora pachyrhizi TaxID=170000 RepID=A0AAV0ARX8_PHAPC|nr:hypothetical protein PPACK8108_LOCUS6940 [Phakopsora pachyrhizi]
MKSSIYADITGSEKIGLDRKKYYANSQYFLPQSQRPQTILQIAISPVNNTLYCDISNHPDKGAPRAWTFGEYP